MNKVKNNGITLVALVVTIIILLILAGITIFQLTGSGLFENAKLAEQKSKASQEKEEGILNDYENKIGEYVKGSRNFQNDSILINDFTITTTSESGNSIKIKVNIEESEDIRGFIYIVNNEVKRVSEEKEVDVIGLTKNTTYKVKVIAIDKEVKTKISKEVSQKTLEQVYVFKDGVVNSEYALTKYTPTNTGVDIMTDNRYRLYASYKNNYAMLYSINPIDFTSIKSVVVNVSICNDGMGLTATFTAGLQSEITQDRTYDENLKVSKATTSSSEVSHEIILDTSNIIGNKYLKFDIHHGSEAVGNTAFAYITSIMFICE